MRGISINFDYKKIKKVTFTKKKYIDVNKILVSEKETYGKYNSLKYFIGYNDNDVIRPLHLKISKMTGYINEFNENENTITMSLRVNDEQLF